MQQNKGWEWELCTLRSCGAKDWEKVNFKNLYNVDSRMRLKSTYVALMRFGEEIILEN